VSVGYTSGVKRTAQKVFGVLAIAAGVAIIVLVIAGVDLWPFGVIVPALVALGWGLYYYAVIRPAPTGVKRPEDSPPHGEEPLR
jgi:drug/metabolite transporter (DMT)-like permease